MTRSGIPTITNGSFSPADGAPPDVVDRSAMPAESGRPKRQPATGTQPTGAVLPRDTGEPGTAGAVLLSYLAEQADRLAAQEQRVRRDEPDSVHQLRVSARRLRSALQAYRPLLERGRTEPIVDGLGTLGRELAPARDAEVLRERISAGLAALDPELRLGAVQALVTRHFGRVEADARAAVLTELDGARYAALRTALDDLLERPPLTDRAARPARRELPRVAARTARKLTKAVQASIELSAPAGAEAGLAARRGEPGPAARNDETRRAARKDEAVHAARKAAKRLRYATDVARPAVGKPAKRFAKGLKSLQKALGEHQDTVVARGALRELGAQAHLSGENGFSFGVLHGQDTARARQTEAQLPALWAAAWRPDRRKWLRH